MDRTSAKILSQTTKPKVSKLRRRETIEGLLFISPWLIGFIFLTGGPFIASLLMSFTQWNILSPPQWIGLENYVEIFTYDLNFRHAVRVTTIYTVIALPLQLALGLALSLLLNMKLRGMGFYRTLVYLPSVLSGVAVSLFWLWIFNRDLGLLNYALSFFGIEPIAWLQNPRYALGALIFMSLWTVGGSTIIYLAGLQNIPTELYEAAKIDGAAAWTRFWRITLPLLTPTVFFLLVMGIIGSFQTFTQAYVMTGGGPMRATYFYIFHLYTEAFTRLNMGYGAALAWILAIVILSFTLTVFKSSPLWVYYEAERKS
jgi:multiple sugar transport system permease protein